MLKENTKEFLEVEEAVKDKVRAFEAGYMNREVEKLDDFMNDMFVKSQGCFILGIGDEEVCLGLHESQELVKNDWESWGSLSLDDRSISLTTDGRKAYFCLEGTVEYCFEDCEERYDRYVKSLSAYFDESSSYRDMTYRARLAQINWLLSMLLSTRQPGPREYRWPLRLSGVACREGDGWRFKVLQFSFKRAGRHPDVRFDSVLSLENAHAEVKERVHMFMLHNNEFNNHEVNAFAQKLQVYYLGNNNVEGLINDGIFSDSITICSTYGVLYAGLEDANSFVELYKRGWEGITIDHNRLLSLYFDGGVYFITTGYLKRHTTQNQSIIQEVSNVKRLLKEDAPSIDKLFRVRRDISRTVMESFKGDNYICPVSIEGFAFKKEGSYCIERLSFNMPSYWIAEGVYD